MAVHLIFCRIIAEVVRPLPPRPLRAPSAPSPRAIVRSPPPFFSVLPRSPPSRRVGRVDERGRALCLTFCKNSLLSSFPAFLRRHHLYVLLVLYLLRLLFSSFSSSASTF